MRTRPSPTALLRRLERLRLRYGGDSAAHKREMVERLASARLSSARQVERLHEALCFLQAYPDDEPVLAAVERALEGFDRRADLRRHGEALADSGIAGTTIWFPFFWVTARWLARRCPGELSIDWDSFEAEDELARQLPLLLPFTESVALDMLDRTPREWLAALAGPGESDAGFLVRRFEALGASEEVRESIYESLDVPIEIAPGSRTPSRTRAKQPGRRVHFQGEPPARGRPDLLAAMREPPRGIRSETPALARAWIDTVRTAMVVRHRDLDAFAYADPRDVRVVDQGGGLEFVCFGLRPERRLLLESVYGFLTVKNGVPIGYVLASSLFGSSEVAYNVFETWRGAEAGHVFGRVLSTVHHLFGSDSFSIDPYQLGHGNEEGLQSGAWWFYYKLGFRPRSAAVKRVLQRELARMRRDPEHRSSLETLDELASDYLFWHAGAPRDDVMGQIDLDVIGDRLSRYLARRFGADREAGLRECAREAEALLGVRTARWGRDERRAWERWSPLVLMLPGVSGWSPAERRAAAAAVRAKGARRESEYVARFNAHPGLRTALASLRLPASPTGRM